MIALKLPNNKQFMSHLLLSETFDHFLVIDGEITTFNTFTINGFFPNIPIGSSSVNFALQ